MIAGEHSALEANWRADVYALLATAYHRPLVAGECAAGEELAKRPPHPWTVPASLDQPGARGEELARLLEDLLQRTASDPAEAVRQDFENLFMVPGPRYVAAYESVYRDAAIEANDRLMPRTYGPSTLEVVGFYDRVGLVVSKVYIELPDYIGLELACMEYLCRREAEYLRKGAGDSARRARALQCRFLRDHLARWVGALTARIRQHTGTGFYGAVAALTAEWVRREAGMPCTEAQCPPP